MTATLVFPMKNDFGQGTKQGICTCSALGCARKTLKLGRGLKTYAEVGLDNHAMDAPA